MIVQDPIPSIFSRSPSATGKSRRRDSLMAADLQLNQAKTVLTSLQDDYQAIISELEKCRAQAGVLNALNNLLGATNVPLGQLLAQAENLAQQASMTNDPDLEAPIKRIVDTLKQLQQQKDARDRNFTDQRGEISRRSEDLQRQLQKSMRDRDQTEREKANLESSIRSLGETLSSLQKQHDRALQQQRELDGVLSSKYNTSPIESQLSSHLKELERTKSELGENEQIMNGLQQLVYEKLTTMRSLEEKRKSVMDHRDRAMQVVTRVERARALDNDKLKSTADHIAELENLLPSLNAQRADLERRREARLQDYDTKRHQYELEQQDLLGIIPKEEHRLQAVRAEIAMLQQEERNIEQIIVKRKNSLSEVMTSVKQIQADRDGAIPIIDQDLKETQRRQDAVIHVLQQERHNLLVLESQRQDVSKEWADANKLLEDLSRVMKEVEDNEVAVSAEYRSANDRFQNSAYSKRDYVLQAQARIKDLQNSVRSAHDAIQRLHTERDRLLAKEWHPLQNDLTRATSDLSALQSQMNSLHEQYTALNNRLASVHSDLYSQQDLLRSLQEQLRQLDQAQRSSVESEYLGKIVPRITSAMIIHDEHTKMLENSLVSLRASIDKQIAIVKDAEALSQFVVLTESENQDLYRQEHELLTEAGNEPVPEQSSAVSRIPETSPGSYPSAREEPQPQSLPQIERISIRSAAFTLEAAVPEPQPAVERLSTVSPVSSYSRPSTEPSPISAGTREQDRVPSISRPIQGPQTTGLGTQQYQRQQSYQPSSQQPRGFMDLLSDIFKP